MVLTLPGIAPAQKKIRGNVPQILADELRVIRFLAVHRAIARNALLIEASQIVNDDFVELNKLEKACIDESKPKARTIDRVLLEIGKNLDSNICYFLSATYSADTEFGD